jgi:hypothetical protein
MALSANCFRPGDYHDDRRRNEKGRQTKVAMIWLLISLNMSQEYIVGAPIVLGAYATEDLCKTAATSDNGWLNPKASVHGPGWKDWCIPLARQAYGHLLPDMNFDVEKYIKENSK